MNPPPRASGDLDLLPRPLRPVPARGPAGESNEHRVNPRIKAQTSAVFHPLRRESPSLSCPTSATRGIRPDQMTARSDPRAMRRSWTPACGNFASDRLSRQSSRKAHVPSTIPPIFAHPAGVGMIRLKHHVAVEPPNAPP